MPFNPHFARAYLWLAERLYHEFAWAYDPVSWLVSRGRWDAWRAEVLDYLAGPRVLEIGFGTGELLAALARRGYQVVGVELSPAMQRVTARKLRKQGLGALPRLRGRSSALPFAAGAFDSVVSTFPSPYILEPDTFAEIGRLLRPPDPPKVPGGRLVVVGLASPARGVLQRLPLEALQPVGESAWRAAGWLITIVQPCLGDRQAGLPLFIFEKRQASDDHE